MPESLKVGLNLVYLVEDSGGSSRYARELIPALMAAEPRIELTAWVGSTAPADLMDEPWAQYVRWVRLPVPGVGTPWHLLYELGAIGAAASRRRLDVFHGLAFLKPFVNPGVASVITIHDVTWLHDPAASGWRFSVVMRAVTPVLARTCDRLITISDAARDDIAQSLRIDPAKFDVTPLGINVSGMPASAGPAAGQAASSARADGGEAVVEDSDAASLQHLGIGNEPVVLCVAAKRAHKNLHGLIEALALLAEPRPRLVLPGSPNEYEQQLRDLAARLGVSDDVTFAGWVSERELDALYRRAACFVLPSFREGFGLPVLEAMARGVPVACSDIPALREVAGDAAVLFDPHDPATIARAIEQVLSDPRGARALVRRGHERCKQFTWARTAEATLASYRRALGRG